MAALQLLERLTTLLPVAVVHPQLAVMVTEQPQAETAGLAPHHQ
jgi:hypothetical protein